MKFMAAKTLFKRSVLTIAYGRIGRVSTTRHYLFDSDAELKKKTQAPLKEKVILKKAHWH